MHIKKGVIMEGLKPEMQFALGFIEAVWRIRGLGSPILTSALDSHEDRPQSLHLKGFALDFRTRNLTPNLAAGVCGDLKTHLDRLGFDTVLEKDHIHVEYDPKYGEVIFNMD